MLGEVQVHIQDVGDNHVCCGRRAMGWDKTTSIMHASVVWRDRNQPLQKGEYSCEECKRIAAENVARRRKTLGLDGGTP